MTSFPFAITLAADLARVALTGVDLRWVAPSTCPGEQVVADDLTALTAGAVVVRPDEAVVTANAVIELHAQGFKLRLELVTPEGPRPPRELEAERCETLAQATAMMIAVEAAPIETAEHLGTRLETTVDVVALPPAIQEPAIQEQPPTVPDPFPPDPDVNHRDVGGPTGTSTDALEPRRPRFDHRAVLGLWGGVAVGLVPATSGVLGGDVGWQVDAFHLALVGWHVFAATHDFSEGVGIRASLSGGGIRVAWTPRVRDLAFRVGLAVEGAMLTGRGVGEQVDGEDSRTFWMGLTPVFGLTFPARSRIRFMAEVDTTIVVRRPGIYLAAPEDVAFRTAGFGVRVIVGPQLRLP